MNSKILAIIPALDEEDSLADVIAGVRAAVPGIHIVVIDDGSTDRTATIARDAGVTVIGHAYNLGYGAALQTGFLYAARTGYDYTVQIDADGQHEPACIGDLLAVVQSGEADVAVGTRFGPASRYRTTLFRRLGMRVFGRLTSVLVGRKVTDPTSGFQAQNKKAVTRFYASEPYPVDFPDADVLITLHRMGFRTCEVPVTMYPNRRRRSMHKGFGPAYYVFKMFLCIFLAAIRKRPESGPPARGPDR